MAIKTYRTKNGELRYQATHWSSNEAGPSQTFKRKIDAKEWLKRRQIQAVDSKVGRLKGEKMTLIDFFHQVYWLNKKIREGTGKDYKRIFDNFISPAFGDKFLPDLSEDDWAGFLSGLVIKGMSHARANRIHAVASGIYKMAVKLRYVMDNPLQRVDWFELELHDFAYWTFDEVEKFLNWAFKTGNPRFALYQAAYETGMRLSELVGLQRDCIDLQSGVVTVRRSFCKATQKMVQTTKSGKGRVLGLNASLKSTLQRELLQHSSPFAFCNEDGEPLTHNGIRHHFEKDQAKANMRRITFHDLRHTYASHYVMRGGNIYDLKELLGHAGIETTMRYAHLAPDHLKAKSSLVSFKCPIEGNVVALNSSSPKYFPSIDPQNEHSSELLTEGKSKDILSKSAKNS